MAEGETTTESSVNNIAKLNQAEAFVAILSIESFPKTPQDTPDRFTIPIDALGNLVEKTNQTFIDGNERYQTIRWSNKIGYNPSKVILGTHDNVTYDKSFKDIVQRYVSGMLNLIDWHSHSKDEPPYEKRYESEFSKPDTTSSVKAPVGASYISLATTAYGIEAIVQTEKALEKTKNIIARIVRVFLFGYSVAVTDLQKRQYATLLAKYGLAYYISADPINSPISGMLLPEKLEKGLVMQRVEPYKPEPNDSEEDELPFVPTRFTNK